MNYLWAGHWTNHSLMLSWSSGCFQKICLRNPPSGCLTSTTSVRNCSKMVSTRSSFGQNTSKNAVRMVMMLWCIPSSVITFSRTSKKAVLPCTSRGKQASRSRLTGLVIRQRLLIRIPVKLPKHGSLLVLWPTASMLLSKRSSMNNKSHGLPLMSICTSSLAALRRFWYQTMLLQQRTVNRVTNMSLSWLSPMRNWHSITTLLSFRPGYVPRRISQV